MKISSNLMQNLIVKTTYIMLRCMSTFLYLPVFIVRKGRKTKCCTHIKLVIIIFKGHIFKKDKTLMKKYKKR